MEDNIKEFKSFTGKVLRTIFYGLISILLLGIFVILISSYNTEVYKPKYKIEISAASKIKEYKCDTFKIEDNKYYLYDTNNIVSNLIIIPTSYIVEIKPNI